MNHIFLGRPIHWALVALLALGGWGLGRIRLHVTDFNLFVIALILATVAILGVVLWTSGAGRAVTRDPIPEPEPDASD